MQLNYNAQKINIFSNADEHFTFEFILYFSPRMKEFFCTEEDFYS